MYKRYKKMKDSNEDSIGNIPEHWNIIKLGHVCNVIDPQPDHRAPALAQGEGFPYIGIRDINKDGTINVDTSRKVEEDAIIKQEQSFTINDGDIVFCKVGTLGIPRIIKPHCRIAISATLVLIKSFPKKIDNTFLLHTLDCSSIYKQIGKVSTGSTREALGIQQIRKFVITFPPIPEQKAIAAFLDRETSRIDKLIDKKERHIELLKEKRQALITRAVTRGLDPAVKMKDSGVEWIGEIPEHWEVKPGFAVFEEQKVRNDNMREDNVLSLSYGNIIQRDVETNFGLLPESFETYQIVFPGNIILRLTDLQNDKRSLRTGLVKEKGIITSAYICLKLKKYILSEYAYLLLHSYDIQKVFYNLGGGVRQSMKFEELRRLDMIVPPISEQTYIVEFTTNAVVNIDTIILKIQVQIDKLSELRQTLISDAVTGKIDVRQEEHI